MQFNIVTLFPEFFASPLTTSLLKQAQIKGLLDFNFFNPRDFALNKHRHVDDRPYSGGLGMVLQVQPILDAVRTIPKPGRILLTSPGGKIVDQKFVKEIAQEENITIICGRYEGIDQRLSLLLPIEEISVGPLVLNGGETAALTVIESVARLIPGFLGKDSSAEDESYANGLLEYPQYTRPPVFEDKSVPEILLGGNHAKINKWKRKMSLFKTLQTNPDLLNDAFLSQEDITVLADFCRCRFGRNISFCLAHYPVWLDKYKTGISSLTNLDIHDISRISCAYGMGPFFVLTPLTEQFELLKTLVDYWTKGAGSRRNPDRRAALSKVVSIESYEELARKAKDYYGKEPIYIVTSAQWQKESLPCKEILNLCQNRPVIIVLGTAKGLATDELPFEFQTVRPIRFLDQNHLSVRAAAAILADRILGDFN